MSSVEEDTTQLGEFLEELCRVAYCEAPVSYEMVRQFNAKIAAAIADGDTEALNKMRNWFVMLPSEDFALNQFDELTDLRDLLGLLDVALDLVIPARVVREVRESQYKRVIIEFVFITGSAMGYQIAKPFHLDEEETNAAATWLRSQGFLVGAMVHPDDPGFTWTITPRGLRLYEALYK